MKWVYVVTKWYPSITSAFGENLKAQLCIYIVVIFYGRWITKPTNVSFQTGRKSILLKIIPVCHLINKTSYQLYESFLSRLYKFKLTVFSNSISFWYLGKGTWVWKRIIGAHFRKKVVNINKKLSKFLSSWYYSYV